jgi:DNA uptake protein ComE-like DNA-binding protein
MTDPHNPLTGPAVVRPERKTGIWAIPPVVLTSIVALVLVIGYQLWQLTQPTFPLDLNSATEKHLMKLPGIDGAAAQKIIAGRSYKRKDDLVHKKILEHAQYEQIKEQIIAKQR